MNKEMVLLLALPRSGITLTTAILDVHPEIGSWFEPWHTRQKENPRPYTSIEDFISQYKKIFGIDLSDKKVLMFKETSAHAPAIPWSYESLKNIQKNNNINIKIIWLLREIGHSYLSLIHTSKKHWGRNDLDINEESFNTYIESAFFGFKQIMEVLRDFDSAIVSYEGLVKNTNENLKKMMDLLYLFKNLNIKGL